MVDATGALDSVNAAVRLVFAMHRPSTDVSDWVLEAAIENPLILSSDAARFLGPNPRAAELVPAIAASLRGVPKHYDESSLEVLSVIVEHLNRRSTPVVLDDSTLQQLLVCLRNLHTLIRTLRGTQGRVEVALGHAVTACAGLGHPRLLDAIVDIFGDKEVHGQFLSAHLIEALHVHPHLRPRIAAVARDRSGAEGATLRAEELLRRFAR